MATFWLVSYVLVVMSFFIGIAFWARQKKREFKKPLARRKLTPAMEFLFRDLPPDFYVSVQFCIGFIIAAIVASAFFSYVTRN